MKLASIAELEGFLRLPRKARPHRLSMEGRIDAAVLVPLHEGARGPEVWAIKRPDGLRHHAREVAFPGGKVDPSDRDLEDTAFREAEEELGVPRTRMRMLGPLEPVPTATSRFTLHPFLAEVARGTVAEPAADEVAALIVMPLADFFAGRVPYRAIAIGDWRSPIFDFEVGSMYGASAHIMLEMLDAWAALAGLTVPEPTLTDEIPWQ